MNRLKIILKEDRTLHEMMTGITVINILLAVVAAFMTQRRSALCAVGIGTFIALVYVIHMAVTIDDALSLDEKGAVSQVRKHMVIRYVFVCIVFAASVYFKIAHPIFLTLSVLTIKAGAYLQPTIHGLFNRRKDK